ncbi:MAG TPA: acetyl-CoA carboxylase biotin carboxyl carrier protein subunit, partial [Negativicutes bacterium]|nr:acetyl-CoA carboxylase biotin carboxyl carrier protein subunit [Negativicutes bacterium]
DTPIAAPMPGKVSKIMKKAGDKIAKGECIMTLEAMKMQNEIGAPVGGTIKSINVNKGDGVKPGQIMAVISN